MTTLLKTLNVTFLSIRTDIKKKRFAHISLSIVCVQWENRKKKKNLRSIFIATVKDQERVWLSKEIFFVQFVAAKLHQYWLLIKRTHKHRLHDDIQEKKYEEKRGEQKRQKEIRSREENFEHEKDEMRQEENQLEKKK